MNTVQKAYSQPLEILEGCRLSSPVTHDQAQALGAMLATSEPWASLNYSAATLANYLLRDDAALHRYAVSVEGQTAGVICVRYPWLRGPYIELLGVSPACRGRGIGRQLIAWAEAQARLESRNLWVLTSSFNLRALDFYQDQGFRPVGPIQGLVSPEHDELLLRKILD